MDIRTVIRPQFNKKRKPNWSENEISFLLREFEKNKGILTSKLCGETTSQQKRQVWKLICDGLNTRNPYVKRTTEEVRRKWKNLLSASKRELLESKRPYVEGGPPPRPISNISRRVIKLRGSVRSTQQMYAPVSGQSDETRQQAYRHALPTMVHVDHNSNDNDSDDFDDLDDNLDDADTTEYEIQAENIQLNNTSTHTFSPKKENISNAIIETKFTPKEGKEIDENYRSEHSNGDLQIRETSSDVSPHVIGNGKREMSDHRELNNDIGDSNSVSSRSSSPFSDITHGPPAAEMLNIHPEMCNGFPIFSANGVSTHARYPMYNGRVQTDRLSYMHPRISSEYDENGETLSDIQSEILSIQRDKLRLEKEVLELYKEKMRMEVEWWKNRLQRTTGSHRSQNNYR